MALDYEFRAVSFPPTEEHQKRDTLMCPLTLL
jgi:hypothetical protein